jgi:hypothetical protein
MGGYGAIQIFIRRISNVYVNCPIFPVYIMLFNSNQGENGGDFEF